LDVTQKAPFQIHMSNKQFAVLFALGAALRFAFLGAANLWYDESFTAWIASLPIPRLLLAAAGDVHPPLYYGIIWILEHLGLTSEAWLRVPSVIFSLAGIWLAWKICQNLNWPAAAQIAGIAFMVFSPLQIHFAQEARMYALLQLELLAGLYAVLSRQWTLLGVSILAALYTQNYALFYLPALGLIGLAGEMVRPVHYAVLPEGFTRDPRWSSPDDCSNLKGLMLAMVLPCLAWLPWVGVLAGQMSKVSAGYWIQPVTPGSIVYTLQMLFWAFAMPDRWQPISIMITIGALTFTVIRLAQIRPNGGMAMLLFALLPITMAVITSIFWKPILLFRGLIASAPLLYLLVGWSLSRVSNHYRLYAAFLICPVMIAGLIGYYVNGPTNKGHIQDEINSVRAHWQPGDIIYHVNDGSQVGWGWYGRDLPQFKMPPCQSEPLGALSPATRAGLGIIEKPLDQIQYKRVWIIWGEGPTSPKCEDDIAGELVGAARLFFMDQDDQYVKSGIWIYEPEKRNTTTN
jgi:mannosyltransferase